MRTYSILELKYRTDFGGASSIKGTTGPFWVGSGLAILSATVVFFCVKPLTHDGMAAEDEAVCVLYHLLSNGLMMFVLQFRLYLEEHGFDTSRMGIQDSDTSSDYKTDMKVTA